MRFIFKECAIPSRMERLWNHPFTLSGGVVLVQGGEAMNNLVAKSRFNPLIFSLFLLFLIGGCTKKQVKKAEIEKTEVIEEKAEVGEVEKEELVIEELDIHDRDFVGSKNLGSVYFDYDSSQLTESSRKTISSNADFLKKTPDIEILVEGHCDERGTIGYNLALGQKRAATVRKYYLSLGIDPKMVGSISYGKEKPVCLENSEECWTTNRRSETKILAPKIANSHKGREKTMGK